MCSAIFRTIRNVQASAQPSPLRSVRLPRLASCPRPEISQEANQGSRCCSWKCSCQSQASMRFSCQILSTQMPTVSGSCTGVVRGRAWRRTFSTLQLTGRSSAKGVILLTYAGMLCIASHCFPARESSCLMMKICTRDGTGSTLGKLCPEEGNLVRIDSYTHLCVR